METRGRATTAALFTGQRVLQFFSAGEYSILPAVSVGLREELGLGHLDVGMLGACSYAGLVVSYIISSYLFQTFSTLAVLRSCILLGCGACALKIMSVNFEMLALGCFISGLGHGPVVVWMPTWIDNYAPEGWATVWMGMWGVTNVAGNLTFYALSAYLYYGLGITWRICFGICLAVQLSCWLVSLCLSRMEIQSHKDVEVRYDLLCRFPVLLCLCLVTACQNFSMSGLEYFAPAYFTQDLGVSKGNAAVLYLVCGGGILLGAAVGSMAGEYFGGYRNRQSSMLFCLGLALIAALALPFLYAPQRPYHTCAVATWVLTLHAAIAPLIVGLGLNSVPGQRTQSSALMNLTSTLLGYVMGPAACGVAAERGGIIWGWRMAWIPPLSLAPMFLLGSYLVERVRPVVEEEDAKGADANLKNA
jgi:predicted MFS family arabinose efflux permease